MKKFIFLVIVFIGLYFMGRIALVWNAPNSDSTDRVNLTITSGLTLTDISEILAKNDLIQDAFVFKIFAKVKGLSAKFQAGEFIIQKNLTFLEISDILQHGKGSEIKVTIPEGSTIAQIDEILSKKSLSKSGDFTSCTNTCNLGFHASFLEGYLFPSTYYVNPVNFTVKSFITRLYNTFHAQIKSLQQDIQETGYTLDQIVIMASMVEREAFIDNEMPIIAGILWKRLDEGIALGVDATTRFELNEWKRPLYTEDFEKNTPYNTRKNRGLPPTAISNPGIEAIKAAIYFEESPYYYYLHDSSGQIHYAEDLNGHVENKERHLQ